MVIIPPRIKSSSDILLRNSVTLESLAQRFLSATMMWLILPAESLISVATSLWLIHAVEPRLRFGVTPKIAALIFHSESFLSLLGPSICW